ncbi:phosphate transport system regulatory protein [Salmonella enterica subsp. enterica]|uniref:Phosphate transport system regulatory protein n=1 Tax=Salmonella enterica I TaxID=59201 RepID=A0A379UYP9_SALET|nr:phosphate transport system regulatory protein [Salmonella enterica subsp. enterica]
MDSLNLNKHISGQFNAELESIRTQVMTMGRHGGAAAF